MAYTTDRTYVTGEVETASIFNTYLRDNMKWLSTDKPMARVYNSANISIANVTNTSLTLDSERFDNASIHSTSSNTERLTVPSGGGGKYLIGATAQFAANATGFRQWKLELNGTGATGTDICFTTEPTNSASVISDGVPVTLYSLAAADYVALTVFQNSGGNLNATVDANNACEFWCLWVGV